MSKKETDIQKLAEKFIETRSSDDFGNLYQRIKYGLRTYIYEIVKNNDDIDEVEIAVLEKIWKNIHMYDPEKAKFSTWLYKIALFDSLQYSANKVKKTKNFLPEDISNIYSSTLHGSDCNNTESFTVSDNLNFETKNGVDFYIETRSEIAESLYDASVNCINMLPENYRFVLTEKLLEDKTIVQIAEDNNLPVTTIKNWLFKGRLQLRELIKKNYRVIYDKYFEYEEY